ncbi:MAG TPA: hypothetical protein PLI70_05500 [Gemmatimonadales bacterium]|nr:hypothetical protein [Gemmatimonadales bacterium]HRZ09128.1 hypothetical protein [Gemmatimonadales bacterium]
MKTARVAPRTAEHLWARARELVRRGAPFSPAEADELRAVHPQIYGRAIRDGLDVVTIQTVAAFRRFIRDVE